MRKKTRKKAAKILSIFLLLSFIMSIIPTIVHAEGYSSFLNEYMTNTQSSINTAKSNPTDANIQNAINNFYNLSLDGPTLINDTDYIIQMHKSILEIIKTLSEDEQLKYSQIMFKKAIDTSDYFTDVSAVTLLKKYPSLKDSLPNYYNKVIQRNPDVGQSVQVDYKPGMPKENQLAPGTEQYVEKFKDDPNYGNETTQDINYYTQGGKCYKKTTSYKGADTAKTSDELVSDSDIGCGYNNGNNDFNFFDFGTSISKNNDSLSDGSDIDKLNVKEESNLTLQYTLTKDSDYAIYYDSGIRVSTEDKIKYSQIKDVMYQVATKEKGQFIEDSGQFMVLLENKLFIYKDEGDIPYSKFEELFSTFTKTEVKALDTKIGTACSLTDYLEIKKTSKILLNKEEFEIKNKPIISRNISIFPIEEFAKMMNGTTQISDDKVIVNTNNGTVIYEDGKDYALVNGLKISLQVESKKNSDGVLMADIYPMLDKLGYDMEWNPDDLSLNVYSK